MNVQAFWLYERWLTLGPALGQAIPWPMDPVERELLIDQLDFCIRYDAELWRQKREQYRSQH